MAQICLMTSKVESKSQYFQICFRLRVWDTSICFVLPIKMSSTFIGRCKFLLNLEHFELFIIYKVVNSPGIPFSYNRFEGRLFECYHHTLLFCILLSGLMRGIFWFIFFIYRREKLFAFLFYGFYLQFGFATAWLYDFAGCKIVSRPK